MNGLIKKIQADKLEFYCLILGLILFLLSAALVGIFYFQLPPIIPLFNQMPWGEARLGEKIQIFIPLGLGFSLYLINGIISLYMYDNQPLISRILCITGMTIGLFICLFVIRTIQIII